MKKSKRTKVIRKSKSKKHTVIFTALGCLAIMAVSTVSLAIVTAKAQSKEAVPAATVDTAADPDQIEVKAENVQYYIDENQYRIELDELQEEIEEIIADTKAITGGEWSVYVSVPFSGDVLSINQKKMQAASVIKLFIMGAVYDDYDSLTKHYADYDVDSLIEDMIILSDNDAADLLVTMLGRGDSVKGRKIVTDYCRNLGLENTSMERMMHDDNDVSDNYTTTEDTAKYLEMILNGEFKHSKEMLKYMEEQTRVSKIPAGIPTSVTIANKTGELDDVQNDAAIVFAKHPYVICVMSDGVIDYQTPIDGIVEISNKTYNYLVTKM